MARPKRGAESKGARERIVSAFSGLARNMPMSEITVSHVCREAHCNKTTFYYYFDTFDDLKREVIDSILSGFTPENALDGFYERNLFEGERGEELLRKLDLASGIARQNPDGIVSREMSALVSRRMEQAIGKPREQLSPKNRIRFDFLVSGALGIILKYRTEPDGISLEELIEAIYDPILLNAYELLKS
jgi:AcrR family transcriptional regulator